MKLLTVQFSRISCYLLPLGSNVLTPFSDTFIGYPFLIATDHVSHSYKTTGKPRPEVLYNLIFTFSKYGMGGHKILN